MTDEEARDASDCGPWISCDPECPVHGQRAVEERDSTERRLAAAEQMAQALRDAEEYINTYTQPGDYGVGVNSDHDKYERLPLLNGLRAARAAWEAAK